MRGLGSLDTARGVFGVMRELSLDDIRDQAATPPSLLVLSDLESDGLNIAQNLTGTDGSPHVSWRRLQQPGLDYSGFDAVVIFDPNASPDSKRLIDQLRKGKSDLAAVAFLSLDPDDSRATREARASILAQIPGRVPAYGAFFPSFRAAAVKHVTEEASMANAQFALVANVPSVVPVLGSLATVGADFFVLTKNQLLLIFKIAAIHGKDLHDSSRIFREMIPVVGAGFFWRTVAREASVFLPLMAGTVPKVAVAYTGTMAVGRAADYYYSYGKKPTREMMRSFYQQAIESLKRREFVIRRGNGTTEAEFRIVENDN